MKKNVIAIALASVCGFTALNASAADGQIIFKGAIAEKPCDVAVSSAVGSEIQLGAYPKSKITNANEVFSTRDVIFELTNCPAEFKKVNVHFEGTADTVDTEAFVNQFTPSDGLNTAQGVALRLKEGSTTIIPGSVTALKDISAGVATLAYKAEFISTKAQADIVAGGFSTNVDYTMNYE
ncbi:type 1 fimbrial protein [Salmonella enterica subsp. enterica]|nr:type 1 fimbrial protein [Salmonella enterica]EEC4901397.1 type 1 fimbrial protein [Salmonella enterica subsp. enterica serovar Kampala]EGB9339921.1 type 1 fimbrial protein [Salmonella enterica]HCB4520152.1 type 1 fimbrial protein [Salmonella enterica]HCB4567668.1 type 1 fimbrial protein [Salmonella enterica]